MKWFEEACDVLEALLILLITVAFVFYVTRELII
tara:strand:+ start:21 stop:122 length:102 start_codon:yes stop_codon:yes gene_type:complete